MVRITTGHLMCGGDGCVMTLAARLGVYKIAIHLKKIPQESGRRQPQKWEAALGERGRRPPESTPLSGGGRPPSATLLLGTTGPLLTTSLLPVQLVSCT